LERIAKVNKADHISGQRIAHTETEPLRNIAVSPVQVVQSMGVRD